MRGFKGVGIFFLWAVMSWGSISGWTLVYAQDSDPTRRIPGGIYIELTRDFYEALRNETARGAKVYTSDPSQEYLREIAVSTRFMVETNLQILKQQEQMIRLLNDLQEGKKK
jgi:hypothetical protein